MVKGKKRKLLSFPVLLVLVILLSIVGVAVATGGDSYYSWLRVGGSQSSSEWVGRDGVADSELVIGLGGLTVVTSPATDVGMVTAVLNGYLEVWAGLPCEYRFIYGETVACASSTPWTNGLAEDETFQDTVTGLTPGTLHYFRAQCRDGANTGVGGLLTFTTGTAVGGPRYLIADPISDSEISLSWVKGADSPQTEVRYKTTGYPTDYDDGILAYQGYSSSYLVTGLDAGVTYYFRAWGFDWPVIYSAGFTSDMATTVMGIGVGTPYGIPGEPGDWFTSSDPSGLSNMPGYGVIENAAEGIGMPTGTMFLILAILLVIGMGALTFVITHSIMAVLVVMLFGFAACFAAGIIPGWFFFTYAFLGVSGGLVLRGGVT